MCRGRKKKKKDSANLEGNYCKGGNSKKKSQRDTLRPPGETTPERARGKDASVRSDNVYEQLKSTKGSRTPFFSRDPNAGEWEDEVENPVRNGKKGSPHGKSKIDSQTEGENMSKGTAYPMLKNLLCSQERR